MTVVCGAFPNAGAIEDAVVVVLNVNVVDKVLLAVVAFVVVKLILD